MKYSLLLNKMESENTLPVSYFLYSQDSRILMNSFLGKEIHIAYQGIINCMHCNREIKKTFFQGYCYPCFSSLPQTDKSVVNPELCEAHNGVSRDMEWAKKNCLVDHYVYLSATSNIKVGVTRHTQIPTRWIDQGAEKAIKLAKTPYRQLAGLIEVELKQYLNDKTNWRKMLTQSINNSVDLLEKKEELIEYLPEEYQYYIEDDDEVYAIEFPVQHYPEKVKSISLDKTNTYSGKLIGIKGQYLLFNDGHVFNVRKHGGYNVTIQV